MKSFETYLEKTKEIGYVEEILHTLAYASGIPSVKPFELVFFEGGQMGQVISLDEGRVEILILSKMGVEVGERVVRTGEQLTVPVGPGILGNVIDPFGVPINKRKSYQGVEEHRSTKVYPPSINARKNITRQFQTGITIIDLMLAIGMGQRELVIGDRKSGKTQFLLRAANAAAEKGIVVVYAGIAKKNLDLKMIEKYFVDRGFMNNSVMVVSGSSDPAGLTYIVPYTAMTIAEYFRDKGKDVLVILDDLTAHAKYYREITLLGKRFPGRSSYPGDIFYIHSRLLERAGNFVYYEKGADGRMTQKESSITCLPVAELVMGDLSGYIQTNLMSMTDGHIFFDIDYYNEGKRPAINPFLSVTRVGRQTQSPLVRDVNRELTSFFVKIEELKQFMHFGTEVSEQTKKEISLGERISAFIDQPGIEVIPLNINIVIFASLWAGYWSDKNEIILKEELGFIRKAYTEDKKYSASIDAIISQAKTLPELVSLIGANATTIFSPVENSTKPKTSS